MSKKTTWERTSVQSLLRNRSSGNYYGRWKITVNGKSKHKWINLKTDVFSVAKLRVGDEAAKINGTRQSASNVTAGKGTIGDLIKIYEERTKTDSDLKPSSITAKLVALKKLAKTWPGIDKLKPTQITPAAVQDWAKRFKSEGTMFTPPGSKTVIKGNSATSVNRTIDTLRKLMDIAVQRGAIHANPVTVKSSDGKPLKKKIRKTELQLPSFTDVQRLFAEIENNGSVGGWGAEAADLCRFLAFSGCRIGEVKGVTWACVDMEKKLLRVRGVEPANRDHNALKTENSDRLVPLFADLEALLVKVQERRKKAAIYTVDGKPMLAPSDRVFRLSEAQKSIDRACAVLGIQRVTHHDFRHLFATRCIEAGVDFLTISRWMGHNDGGVLVMKTYGHLRQDHSQTMAAKVSFGNAT
jgi:integrase